jgi:Ca2+-binding RTX toxin-like protein
MQKSNFNAIQTLEPRRLLAASASLASGTLTIRGDSADDVISATNQATPRPEIVVNLNGQSHSFDANQVNKLRINTGPGNDRIELGGAFWRPTIIRLGAGDDYAFGSGRNDRISGGDGNDTINASAGSDQVFGDAGDDELEGAEGNDTVSGGAGNDIIGGFNGRNLLRGDEGDDTFYTTRLGRGSIEGGTGLDTTWHRGADSDWSILDTERLRR